MRKAKNPNVGDVIEFPLYQFSQQRSGWNGWIFRAGIIEKLYISKSGERCATVRYCARTAGRYQLLPNKETTVNRKLVHLFEYDVKFQEKFYRELREEELKGTPVCWSEDTALLVNHGLIKEEGDDDV